jgi:cytochrome c553
MARILGATSCHNIQPFPGMARGVPCHLAPLPPPAAHPLGAQILEIAIPSPTEKTKKIVDTTVGWQRQYEGLQFPLLSSTSIQNSVLHQPTLQYPPVDAPKCGRPKKTGRIKSSVETQRQRVAVRCSKCHGVGHNSRNVKCPQFARS